MGEVLKQCPFCGANAFCEDLKDAGGERWIVACFACPAEIRERSEAEAVSAWNTRVQPEDPSHGL